ncbi:MAG: ribonuclease P protein component 1 [Candidatus Hydrothermarchaeales archaeon]
MTEIKIKPRDLIRHELIGLQCRVLDATDPSIVGCEGEVVDETRNMLILKNDVRERKIPKKDATFLFALPGRKVKVKGKLLVARPEDRIKKRILRS